MFFFPLKWEDPRSIWKENCRVNFMQVCYTKRIWLEIYAGHVVSLECLMKAILTLDDQNGQPPQYPTS